jgi:hypothetical protein
LNFPLFIRNCPASWDMVASPILFWGSGLAF